MYTDTMWLYRRMNTSNLKILESLKSDIQPSGALYNIHITFSTYNLKIHVLNTATLSLSDVC